MQKKAEQARQLYLTLQRNPLSFSSQSLLSLTDHAGIDSGSNLHPICCSLGSADQADPQLIWSPSQIAGSWWKPAPHCRLLRSPQPECSAAEIDQILTSVVSEIVRCQWKVSTIRVYRIKGCLRACCWLINRYSSIGTLHETVTWKRKPKFQPIRTAFLLCHISIYRQEGHSCFEQARVPETTFVVHVQGVSASDETLDF